MSSPLSFTIRFTLLVVGLSATAACSVPATSEPATATAAPAAYPLKTCIVAGGKLGGMGKPVVYVYKQAGQPDRTVMFCCKACIRKFEREPARYLAKLDAAAVPAGTANQQ